ncbi:MAG: PAS domain S-box protein, partial [Methanomicrobiales archaeon]|nr:PAS domain S-box protein [Methanomicrobiales archaeon]
LKEREQFIQEIIHNAKEGIIVYDRNFNYRVWNPFMEAITGISATEALGNNAIDLFPHLKEQKIHILLQRALSGETVQSPDTPYHVPQTRKSGWVSGIYSPHFNDQGVIVGVIGIIHDITDWKKADDALRESEGTFKALAENANDGILVAVTEEAHTYANRRVCEMLGYSVTELQKSSIKDLVVPDEAATLIERFRKRLLGEDIPQQYVTSLLHKDGKNVPVEISAAKTSWHGQPADLVIIHDITERKRAEKTMYLFQAYGTENDIRCRIEMGDVTMPIETAIPCGLVMTEIITNSLKYAFPKTFSCKEIRGKSCSITLTLRREDSNYLLNIADNGIGIPERTDVTVTRTLGLYLIKLIVQHQLRGTLDISTDRGTSYTIRFPEPAVKGWEDR